MGRMGDETDGVGFSKVVLKLGDAVDSLRPWRKRALQIITTDIWRKDSVEDIVPLNQVAGHGSHDAKQAILTAKNGCILKPVQAPPKGLREKNFYEKIFKSVDSKSDEFRPFLPKYFGSCKKKSKSGEFGEFLMIENLSQGYVKPCIMDIKIGAKTYGPDATPEKIAKQTADYKGTKAPFGFCVPGLSVHTGDTKETFKILNKEFGHSLNESNINDFLINYLDAETNPSTSKVLSSLFAEKLVPLVTLFRSQTTFHLYGSSLLFVYDAEKVIEFTNGKIDEQKLSEFVRVTMIDFAHVWDGEGRIDDNYLNGVQNLHKIFQTFSTSK